MRSLLSLICILCVTAFSFGQNTLSLDQAIKIALQRNTTLQKAENNLNNSESSVKVAYGNFLPSVNASTSWNWNRSVDDKSRTVLVGGSPLVVSGSTSETRSYSAGVNASITLFDGLSNFATLSQSQNNLESGKLQLENLKQNIVYQTISLYYAVINNEQLLKVQEDNLKWNQRNLETITERNRLGAVTIADVYSQQVTTGNAELALIQAKNNFETAKSNLLSYLALDVLQNYTFDQALTNREKSILDKDLTSDYSDLTALVVKALSNRPDYKSAQFDLETANEGITIARSGHLPRLTGNVSYGLSANEFKNLNDSKSTSVSMTLSLPIFSGFRTSYQVQLAEVNAMNSELTLNDLERQIKQDIQKSYLNLQAAQKSLEVNKRNVTAAEQNTKVEEERYALGSSTLLNVLIANSGYTSARTNFISAQFSYIQLSEQLKYLLGELEYKKYE